MSLEQKPITILIEHDDRLLCQEAVHFCGNADCLCHMDQEHIRLLLLAPLVEGLLTREEMVRLYTGRQVC